jgi:alkanesulfonate monooxygenase SsuD/methylene tetrahydromethanopterin reductase-like flavin-dependent oxidoreductase (luciferase family)
MGVRRWHGSMHDDNRHDAGRDRLRLAVALNGYGLVEETPDGRRPAVLPWRDVLDIVETAEETGYESVFTPEIAAREAFSTLTGLAAVTSSIGLGTGVVRVDRRDPHTTAMAAATVQDLSNGRFILGLGSQDRLERTREFVRLVREMLAGGPAEVPGGLDLPYPMEVPIYLAALGPGMTEVAGEVADGVLLNWCTPERVARACREIARGADRVGRDPAACTVAVYVRTCLGHDDEHALAALSESAGHYASMEKYRRQFDAMGLGAEAAAAAEATAAGRPAAVAEGLLRAVCVWGPREHALERLAAYRDAGADVVVLYPVPAQEAVSSITGTLLAAAPDPAVEH